MTKMQEDSLFAIALKFHTLGYRVIPSGGGDKHKSPIAEWEKYQEKQPSEEQLYQWQEKYHPEVWGCTTGGDFIDIETDTSESTNFLLSAGLKPHLKSPRGGFHFFVQHPPWYVETKAPIRGLKGIDVRGDGGFANFCGSVNGSSYQILEWPTADKLIPFASLPPIIRRGLEPEPETKTTIKHFNLPPLSPEDCQKCSDKLETLPCMVYCHDYAAELPETMWWQMISQFVGLGTAGEEAIHKLSSGYIKGKGYSERETQKKIESTRKSREHKKVGPHLCQSIRDSGFQCPTGCLTQAADKGVTSPVGLAIKLTLTNERLPLNDIGNATRLIRLFGDHIRFVLDMERWLVWNGKYWQFDHGEQMGRLAKKAVMAIGSEATEVEDNKSREAILSWAKQSGSDMRIRALISQARWFEGISVLPTELDANPWLLNVANGTINLASGQLQPHEREDLITRMIPLNYNPDAISERWESTLKQVFSNNDDLICYMRRAIGYSAVGSNQEMAAFFPQGSGFNGKTTMLGAISDVLGPYARQVDPVVFMVSRNDSRGPNEAIADLYRIRFVLCAEIEANMRLSVGLVKRITGGEELRHERKYEHGFNFKPEFKIWLMSNHEPHIGDSTNSIWGRIRKIPFLHSFEQAERIPNLRQLLIEEEGEAILAWIVYGALEWREFGLCEPKEVQFATAEYRETQDVLHDFLAEKCILEPNATIFVADLYNAYLEWCRENGEGHPLGKLVFSRGLKERDLGVSVKPGAHNKSTWHGIRLLQEG